MPSYDYGCGQGHSFEAFSTIAKRDQPRPCPECGLLGEVMFTLSNPESFIASPHNSQSRWHDIAPPDPTRPGQVMETPGEAYRSGKYEPYDRNVLETAEREKTEQEIRDEPVIQRQSKDKAWRETSKPGYKRPEKLKVGTE